MLLNNACACSGLILIRYAAQVFNMGGVAQQLQEAVQAKVMQSMGELMAGFEDDDSSDEDEGGDLEDADEGEGGGDAEHAGGAIPDASG
jgi:hypothetical protein